VIEIKQRKLPPGLELALSRVNGNYSTIKTVFHIINIDLEYWVGIAGDGANGCYEQFVWKDGILEITDEGWGDTNIALKRLLNKHVRE
jgi:hypothetical protein